MQRPKQIFTLISFLFGFSSCSVIDDTLLTEEVSDFSRGVVVLSSIIKAEFTLAEEVNTLGFTDNLQFQLELGGSADTNLTPLFSAKDISARQSLLAALDGYVETLNSVASGKSLSTLYDEFIGTAGNLKSLDPGDFNLAHSLSFLDSNQLVNDVSLVDELFILPKRDQRLYPVVEKGSALIKKTAILLYFDMGSKADQSSKCSYTFPKNDLKAPMSTLRLCKGGLRSLVANAVSFDTTVWKDKLTYLSGKSAENSNARKVAIQRLVAIQKIGRSLDRLLSETQRALIAMVAAHDTIHDTLVAAEKSKSASLIGALKTILFREKLRSLLETATAVKASLSKLLDSATVAQDFQHPPTDIDLSGESDDK